MTAYEPQDRILAAANDALRIIRTEAELAALRVGAVVIDDEEAVLEKTDPWWWSSTGENTAYEDEDVDLPAVVLYEPQEDQ